MDSVFYELNKNKMNITEIANRIANLHYSEIPKTKGGKMFRRQRVLELKNLIESELKNCSMSDVVKTLPDDEAIKLHSLKKQKTMELDIEIFDKDGKALHIGSVISRYLFKLAEKHDKDVEDLLIGIELSQPIRDDGKNTIELMDLGLNRIDNILCSNGL